MVVRFLGQCSALSDPTTVRALSGFDLSSCVRFADAYNKTSPSPVSKYDRSASINQPEGRELGMRLSPPARFSLTLKQPTTLYVSRSICMHMSLSSARPLLPHSGTRFTLTTTLSSPTNALKNLVLDGEADADSAISRMGCVVNAFNDVTVKALKVWAPHPPAQVVKNLPRLRSSTVGLVSLPATRSQLKG